MLNATDLHEYLIAVSNLLDLWANDDTATAHRPVDGRPSPWDHDRHARPDLQLLRPGRPRVSPGDLRRTAEASRELIQYL